MKSKIKRDWVFWQVVATICTPVVFSLAAVFFSELGPHPYPIKWEIIADTSPWVFAFFCLTLIGSALHDLIDWKSKLGGMLILLGGFIGIFSSYLVYWRETEANFSPGAGVYYVTVVFFLVSIGLCHEAAR